MTGELKQEHGVGPVALFLAPTRELVLQLRAVIGQVCPQLEERTRIAVGKEIPTSKQEFDILIATPVALAVSVALGRCTYITRFRM